MSSVCGLVGHAAMRRATKVACMACEKQPTVLRCMSWRSSEQARLQRQPMHFKTDFITPTDVMRRSENGTMSTTPPCRNFPVLALGI